LATDNDSYNVAEDATQWSTSVKAIHQHAVQYDIMPIFCIPDAFDSDTASTSSTIVDSLIRWKDLQDNNYYEWQEFLHMYGSDINLESDQWMEEFFCYLMDKAFKIEVISDFDELPQQLRGAISLF
jgi:hypothetical protein